MNIELVAIADISLDPALQVRVALDPKTVDDYADVILSGQHLPPVTVFRVNGVLKLVGGFHRFAATKKAGESTIRAILRDGDMSEAVLAAIDSNSKNGLRLNRADTEKAVLMAHGELPEAEHEAIARLVGCSRQTVGRILAKQDKAPEDEDDYKTESEAREPNPFEDDFDAENHDDEGGDITEPKKSHDDPPHEAQPGTTSDDPELDEPIREAGDEIAQAVSLIRRLRRELVTATESDQPGYEHVSNSALLHLQSAADMLAGAVPTKVCPKCDGDGCDFCYNRGWIVKAQEKALD